MAAKKLILSGVKPTNFLTLGNYLGALKQWASLYRNYQCYFSVVDLHSITVRQDPNELRENSYLTAATYIACGIDPEDACIFIQSHVKEHAALSWILTCFSYMGELSRMTQFKDKTQNAGKNIPAGLFSYPVLMAADIFLYDADLVPVGEDQKQHIELARDIAGRINGIYKSDLLKIPEPFIPKAGARIMDLQTPTKKMSKSDSGELGAIYLTDSPKDIEKKFKRAVTDSGSVIAYSDEQQGVKNLLDIQMAITGKTAENLVAAYEGKQYGHLKVETAAIVIQELEPVQKRIRQLMSDKGELERLLRKGADRAREKAAVTYKRVHNAVGFIPTGP
jgi:tryptophanyl-tRNA synthetase